MLVTYMDAEITIRAIIIALALTILVVAVLLFRAFILFPFAVRHRGWKAGFREYPVSGPLGILLMTCALTAVGGWFYYVRWWHLSFVPPAMGVSSILYVKEEAWGFGPGGNETGVIVYELPEEAAEDIRRVGMQYFTALPVKHHTQGFEGWNGVYDTWQPTPVLVEQNLSSGNEVKVVKVPLRIKHYMRMPENGFGIDIDPAIACDIDDAISTPGSFYAYGRAHDLLIVIPRTGRVVLLYAG